MSTLVVDKGKICREASGVNAGTLTIHMTRATTNSHMQLKDGNYG